MRQTRRRLTSYEQRCAASALPPSCPPLIGRLLLSVPPRSCGGLSHIHLGRQASTRGRRGQANTLQRARTDGIISPVSAQFVLKISQNELEECGSQSCSLLLKHRRSEWRVEGPSVFDTASVPDIENQSWLRRNSSRKGAEGGQWHFRAWPRPSMSIPSSF